MHNTIVDVAKVSVLLPAVVGAQKILKNLEGFLEICRI
jgi:hypothetical protein